MYNRTLSVESHTHSVCFCQNGGKPPHNFCTAYNGRRYLLKCSESGAAREWVHSYEVCCIPTIPSEQNGNFVGSIAMKRVPACMFAVVSTVSMGFKSIRIHVCVFYSGKYSSIWILILIACMMRCLPKPREIFCMNSNYEVHQQNGIHMFSVCYNGSIRFILRWYIQNGNQENRNENWEIEKYKMHFVKINEVDIISSRLHDTAIILSLLKMWHVGNFISDGNFFDCTVYGTTLLCLRTVGFYTFSSPQRFTSRSQ